MNAREMLYSSIRASGHDPEKMRIGTAKEAHTAVEAVEAPVVLETVEIAPVAPPASPLVREMTATEIAEQFYQLAKSDKSYLERLAHRFDHAYPFAKAIEIKACPLLKAASIEIALSDAGAPKQTKRERAERETMRFTGRIQICAGTNQQISKPDWQGQLAFRNADRATKDIVKLRRQKNFNDSFADMAQAIIDHMGKDTLYGFMRADTKEMGSPHVDGFLFLADKNELAAHKPNITIIALDEKGRTKIDLPPFDTKTNNGGALGGAFVMQCRASKTKRDWATGLIESERA